MHFLHVEAQLGQDDAIAEIAFLHLGVVQAHVAAPNQDAAGPAAVDRRDEPHPHFIIGISFLSQERKARFSLLDGKNGFVKIHGERAQRGDFLSLLLIGKIAFVYHCFREPEAADSADRDFIARRRQDMVPGGQGNGQRSEGKEVLFPVECGHCAVQQRFPVQQHGELLSAVFLQNGQIEAVISRLHHPDSVICCAQSRNFLHLLPIFLPG